MTPRNLQTTRRAFLGGTASAAALAGLPLPLLAQPVPLDQVERAFFDAAEWAFVLAATGRIIPSDGDGPGALETRVPVFIDRELAGDFGNAADLYMEGPHDPTAGADRGPQSPLTPAQIWRQGIAAFDAWCVATLGAAFVDLDPETQDEALTTLSEDETGLPPELSEFWSLMVQNTKEGYFADPRHGGNAGMQAWVYIGFPGARASFHEWIGRNEVYPLGPVSVSGERA